MLRKIFKFDYILAGAVIALLFLGILLLASVSAVISQENFNNTTYYLFHQILYGIIPGLILGIVFFMMPLNILKKLIWVILLINILAMVLVFLPGLGIVAGGAPRWLSLKFFSFQPSEFLKLSIVLYLAAWLINPARKKGTNILLPFLVIAGVVVFLLAKQSDLGTLAIIILTGVVMYFCSNVPFWHLIIIFLIFGGGFLILIKIAPYRIQRILVFLNPELDPMGIGYHAKQIIIGVGSGGILGLGLGGSYQKFGFVPQIMSDSIFSIYAEEMGFLGSLLLIILFGIFVFRSFSLAKKTKDDFSKLFAIGFSSWISLQAFVNIGAMIGLLPLTGIPLPFLSYGGSHIIAELIGVGILLNISRKT